MDLKAVAKSFVEGIRDMYVRDLEELSEEDILNPNLGDKVRSPIDFTYEIIVVNKMIGMRLNGQTPPARDQEGWIVAPEDFRSKAKAIQGITESMDAILLQLDGETDLTRSVEIFGRERSAFEGYMIIATHTMYHVGQLNYLQSMRGDGENHWF